MSKKSRFRGPFDKQHGNGDQTMLKSERHQLYHIFWSLWRILSYKKSLLVICKVLKMFVNILTADDKCFLFNRDNLRQPIQMRLSEKQKEFSEFFSPILKSRLNFEYFQKKMTYTAYIFLKLRAGNTWLNKSFKSSASEHPTTSSIACGT